MSATPVTDALVKVRPGSDGGYRLSVTPITDDITRRPCGTVRKYGLMIDHARKLETDRAALVAALEALGEFLRREGIALPEDLLIQCAEATGHLLGDDC